MHPKQHIPLIPELLKIKGVEQIVISPGSRNAPLIKAFFNTFKENCISIVDERSAAYFASGLSIKSQKPVVLISTSGTATLNYAPAIAEAFHQGIPLIAITADRPAEWIDQLDNQTIRQTNIYSNNIKYSCELPVACSTDDDIWFTNRLINEAFNVAVSGVPGPVHINVPLREPLYDDLPEISTPPEIKIAKIDGIRLSSEISYIWQNMARILIVCGQLPPNSELENLLKKIAESGKAVVVAEAISNIKGGHVIGNADLILASHQGTNADLKPELVIYFGGQIVSKRLKNFLRNLNDTNFWFINPQAKHTDTFKNLSTIIPATPVDFFTKISGLPSNAVDENFTGNWNKCSAKAYEKVNNDVKAVEFSDLQVFRDLSNTITENDIVFAGNSSVVRYIQMFDFKGKRLYSNRGTSGIDGCLSTAAGIAFNSSGNVFVVLGDLSFIYDSNGLWNKRLPENLKIIVINNSGGGIFGMLEGPSTQNFYNEYLVAHHPVNISKLSEAYGVKYSQYSEGENLKNKIDNLRTEPKAALLEIKTPADKNPEIFRTFVYNISKKN